VSAENTYNGEIVYQPTAELRLMSMGHSVNLNKIDLNCFWIDKYGVEHQVLSAARSQRQPETPVQTQAVQLRVQHYT
jgi:hypothetical protein